jgi:hypothetical protein
MTTKKSATRTKFPKSSVRTPVPPYGIAIKEAIARGNAQEMRKLAGSARKYVKDVQTALDKLDKTLAKK